MKKLTTALVALLALAAPKLSRAQSPEDSLPNLAREVLKKHCFDCHGKNPARPKGKLNLFDRAHLDDKERRIVVASKPAESVLMQQVESGEMPPGERPKPTPAEKKVLRDWIAAGGQPFAVEKADFLPPPGDRAAQVKEIFRLRCSECHGGLKTQGGVKILDRQRLLDKKHVIPGRPDESLVFQLITAADGSGMPPAGQPRLQQGEIDAVRLWIAEGAADFPVDVAIPAEPKRDPRFKDLIGVDYIHKKILAHVRDTRIEDRSFKRYFSINHVLTAGATETELQLHREALAKAVNHLSWQAHIVRPTSIDAPADTIYCIDLRDLGWHEQPFWRYADGKKLVRSELNFFDIALLEYPYSIFYEDSDTFDRLVEEFIVPTRQVRPIVYVRADWFVSTITQPPFYEDFLRLPFEVKELEAKLGVDAELNVRDYLAKRAGMPASGVSVNNRVVERHPAKYGAYWKSFDFRSNKGKENIFVDPINLHPAGGEFIFNLPNGLQGYFLANGLGARVELAPTEIVNDKLAEDKIVRNGLACMRCHDRGMKELYDAVRPALERLPGSPGFDKRVALQLYPEQAVIDELLKIDRERFLGAMAKVNSKPTVREPLLPVAHRFLDDPILLTTASGELGLIGPGGLQALFRSPQFTPSWPHASRRGRRSGAPRRLGGFLRSGRARSWSRSADCAHRRSLPRQFPARAG